MELKIYIKQRQDVDSITGQHVYYSGLNPYSLQKVTGTLPTSRQWKQNGLSVYGKFIDMTNYVSNLYEFEIQWSKLFDINGNEATGAQQFTKKSTSGSLTFEGEAYRLIKQWLHDDISAPFNTIEVQISHEGCGKYTDLMLNTNSVRWCEDDICTFDINLKQIDDSLSCIQRTLITDNWQGWFGETRTPASGKKHPRFSYCNEIRPNGLLIAIWWMMAQLSSLIIILAITIGPIINLVITIIKLIVGVINAIINFINALGANINPINDKLDYITAKDIKDIIGNFFVESAGCGREHPAPLIRDYISNVCSKCNVTVNEVTAPLFFSRTMNIETSIDRDAGTGPQLRNNYYYNACYLAPVSAKGIRRFDTLNVFSGANKNSTDWWLPENSPLLTLDAFLDDICGLFNSKWEIKNNTLYIDRKDILRDNVPVFDFSKNHTDRDLLVTGICSEWNEERQPVYTNGLYTEDAADTPGNEALGQTNGIVNFGTTDSPVYNGVNDIRKRFGATRFRLDGAGNDYIYDALQNVANTQFIGVAPWLPPMLENINDNYLSVYADYALLIKQETTTLPKILIWNEAYYDGQPFNAKAIRLKNAWPGTGNPMPTPNTRYNNFPTVRPWNAKHDPKTFVSGSSFSLGTYPAGYYTVRAVFGGLIAQNSAQLVNYPMYFAPEFEGGMWDNFHWIDDPNFNPSMRKNWTAKLQLCCDTLKRLQVFDNGYKVRLDAPVKLPFGFYPDGRITEITIRYNTEDLHGAHIEVKGIA